MFLCTVNLKNEDRVALLGELVKIDQDYVIIRSNNELFRVLPQGFDSFKSRTLLVVGNLKDGILHEEHVHQIEGTFDLNAFQRLAKVSAKYPEIF